MSESNSTVGVLAGAVLATVVSAAGAADVIGTYYPKPATESLCERPRDVPGSCCRITPDEELPKGVTYADAVAFCRENNREAIERQRANGERKKSGIRWSKGKP